MRIPFQLEGHTGQVLEVETAGWFSGPKLLLDGQQAPKGPKRNQYLLPREGGFKQLVQLKQVFIDPVPQIIVDDEVIQLIQPLSLVQWIWSGLPIILIFMGGAIGGAVGGAAFWVNTRIFRSDMSTTERYILVGLTSAISVFIYLILSTIFLRLIS
jgi:hypothetical protein